MLTIPELREHILNKTIEREGWMTTYRNIMSIDTPTSWELVRVIAIISSKVAQCDISIRDHKKDLEDCL